MEIPERVLRATSGVGVVAFLLFGAILVPSIFTSSAQAETAVAPEKNPPGDIPDTQVFINYTSTSGYAFKVPEGWARTETSTGVSFIDKLDGIVVTMARSATAPTLDSVTASYIPELEKTGRAIKIKQITAVNLPAGKAIRIAYSSNSDPNPVTNKQVRLENNRYLFFKNGKLVALDLYAPYGADNVDQWNLVSRSFQWK